MKKNEKSQATSMAKKNQSILIISIFSAIIMIVGIYWYFGQNIVWVPVVGLTALIVAAFYNPYVKKWTKGRNWIKFIIFLPVITGITSALSQIESYGDILFMAFPLLILAILIIKIISMIRAKKAEKRRIEEESIRSHTERVMKEEKEKIMKRKKSEQALQNILASETASWEDILSLSYLYSADTIMSMPNILNKIFTASPRELLIVSDIKKHLVWNNNLIDALRMMEKMTSLSYDDRLLRFRIESMKEFLKFIESKKDYSGYHAITKALEDNCRELLYLANK